MRGDWEKSIKALSEADYRVIAPDQIGFWHRPRHPYRTFAWRDDRHSLCADVSRSVEQLVLVDPIGLEDWQAKGAPYLEIDKDLIVERQTTFDSIKQYEQRIYYGGQWHAEYDRWVEMLAGMFTGSGGDVVSWVQARIFDMAFTQPVVHEFEPLWADRRGPILDALR